MKVSPKLHVIRYKISVGQKFSVTHHRVEMPCNTVFLLQVMSMLAPKTIPMFHFTGDKATTPTCPIEMYPNLNPAFSYQSYESSDANCTKSAKYKLPFFKKNLGPEYEEWSVNVHEGRPGHHTQVSVLLNALCFTEFLTPCCLRLISNYSLCSQLDAIG